MRFHFHWFKLVEDEPEFDWGGLICRRRVYKCRFCKAKQIRMSGSMPL